MYGFEYMGWLHVSSRMFNIPRSFFCSNMLFVGFENCSFIQVNLILFTTNRVRAEGTMKDLKKGRPNLNVNLQLSLMMIYYHHPYCCGWCQRRS